MCPERQNQGILEAWRVTERVGDKERAEFTSAQGQIVGGCEVIEAVRGRVAQYLKVSPLPTCQAHSLLSTRYIHPPTRPRRHPGLDNLGELPRPPMPAEDKGVMSRLEESRTPYLSRHGPDHIPGSYTAEVFQ